MPRLVTNRATSEPPRNRFNKSRSGNRGLVARCCQKMNPLTSTTPTTRLPQVDTSSHPPVTA